MRTIHFNTGRLYSSGGQRITATLREDDMSVTLFDHSRLMDAEFKLCGDRFDEFVVMSAYDQGIARGTQRSFEDGMTIGGCNSRWED